MRAVVFKDAALGKHAGRFVWLSIDTEKDTSAGFLEQFPIQTWPTLLVIDPKDELPALKWLGSATVPQLERLLDDGARAVSNAFGSPVDKSLGQADRLFAAGHSAEAAQAYRKALAASPPGWERRPRVVESLTHALYSAGDYEGCALTAQSEAPGLPRGPSFANTVAFGLACATSGPEEAAWTTPALTSLEPLGTEAVRLPGLLVDDRSGLYELLVDLRTAAADSAGATRLARAWLSFLEAEARKADSPEARTALDSHTLVAAQQAGMPERAIAPLQRSERELPEDYNAPARLALVYRELRRYPEALAAGERALAKVYGPRRLRVLENQASIYLAMGDSAGARRTLEAALRIGERLPPSLRSETVLARLRTQLAKLPASAKQ